jgi:hypothetical protein
MKLFHRKRTGSELPALPTLGVTCKKCQAEILVKGGRDLPDGFSVECPQCRARKWFARDDLHLTKVQKNTSVGFQDKGGSGTTT